jgi:hypothetical protein
LNRCGASDIDTVMVDSLKVFDPRRPIREADIGDLPPNIRFRGKKTDFTNVRADARKMNQAI